MNEKLLEVSVVAKRLAVSVDTVRRMLKDPDNPLEGVRHGKRAFMVFAASVEKVLEERQTNKLQ